MKRILLNYEDFEKLTKGEVIKKEDVEIALEDIGFYKMSEIIKENYLGFVKDKVDVISSKY